MTQTKLALARQLYDAREHSLAEIARTLGVSVNGTCASLKAGRVAGLRSELKIVVGVWILDDIDL